MGYEDTRRVLTLVLYDRGIVLDPYSIMEVATLIHSYFVRGVESDVRGAIELLYRLLEKMGYENAYSMADSIVREVVARVERILDEENHRL